MEKTGIPPAAGCATPALGRRAALKRPPQPKRWLQRALCSAVPKANMRCPPKGGHKKIMKCFTFKIGYAIISMG